MIGRKCDQCVPGTYGLDRQGCKGEKTAEEMTRYFLILQQFGNGQNIALKISEAEKIN